MDTTPGAILAFWGSAPPARPFPACGSLLAAPGRAGTPTAPWPGHPAHPTLLISRIPASGCVSELIKGSLTLSCRLGSTGRAGRLPEGAWRKPGMRHPGLEITGNAAPSREQGWDHTGLCPPDLGKVPPGRGRAGTGPRASFLAGREVYNGNKSQARPKWSFSRGVSCGAAAGALPHATAGAA